MYFKRQAAKNAQPRELSLRLILIVPFVMQIFAAVGLTGYFSLRNGQKAIDTLARQLATEVSSRIDQHLDTYLVTAQNINQTNADAVQLGLLDLNNFEQAGHYFWKQVQLYGMGYIYYVLPSGETASAGYDPRNHAIVVDQRTRQGLLHTYATDREGNRSRLIEVQEYDPFVDASYQAPVKAHKPVWSPIYTWDGYPDIVAISAAYPLYNKNQTLKAVLNVDLQLSQISQFLREIKTSPSGRTFVVERNGLIVASSAKEPPYRLAGDKALRLQATQSDDPLVRATAQQLLRQFNNLNQVNSSQSLHFMLDGKPQFAQVTPWQDEFGLDWLIVVAMPESDFMAQINANTRTTILLCLAALAVATLSGIYTARWITQPILRLSAASQAVAAGDLDQVVTVKGIRELGVLAKTFNQMTDQLQNSFTVLEKTNEVLERRVEERTAELKAAKEAADMASEAKSEFLANMSHELRTPLNGILGYAQVLQRDRSASPKQQDGLNIIYQCGFHLLTLINDILDIAKIEAQKLELNPTEFLLDDLLHGVQEICRVKAEQKEIDFLYEQHNLPTVVYADEKRLRQVLINLLGNAIKFTDRGSVTFSVTAATETIAAFTQVEPKTIAPESQSADPSEFVRIRFQVQDTGIGMTLEQQQKIFLPFEQAGDSNRRAEGTGLGLTISRKIVELMGSEIFVESAPDRGSSFWFELDLPRVATWVEPSAINSVSSITGYRGDRKTILIVDDRWENRSILVNLLEPLGFKLIEAVDGQDGLRQAQDCHPDLIIADLSMPNMDGLAMTQQLRQLEAFHQTIIIASSASVFSFDRQQSREAGCNDFLPKPIQTSELFDRLQHYLGLEWIYESTQDVTLCCAIEDHSTMVIPPAAELTALYKAAKAGYISIIQQEAIRLEGLDLRYSAFAAQVLKLAERFEDEAIVQLLLPHLAIHADSK